MNTSYKFTDIPLKEIVRFGQQTMLDRPLFNVSWILGRFCNYNCSYCWPYARTDKPDHFEYTVYTNAIDEIKRQARENGFTNFHWSFSGGEPTAYKRLLDVVKHLDDGVTTPYQSIHMTTNLSPGTEWWRRFANVTSLLQRRSITASYHSEFAREDEFVNKCLQLQDDTVAVTINQVMVPAQFWELYARCERFYQKGINVTLKPQSDPTASKIIDGYDLNMQEALREGFKQRYEEQEVYQIRLMDKDNNVYFMDQAERFNSFNFNKFTGWACNSGYQSVIIRGDLVKRAYSCRDDILGSLTGGFMLYDRPKVCITPSCVSSADSKIPKCIN